MEQRGGNESTLFVYACCEHDKMKSEELTSIWVRDIGVPLVLRDTSLQFNIF